MLYTDVWKLACRQGRGAGSRYGKLDNNQGGGRSATRAAPATIVLPRGLPFNYHICVSLVSEGRTGHRTLSNNLGVALQVICNVLLPVVLIL